MILAGALTLAGITGATAFIPETKAAAATQEQSFTKFYSLQTGSSSEQEPVFLQKGQELTIQPNSKTPSYSVYDSNHNLIGRYSDGYGRIFTAKQMGICTFNFMHLMFTIVLLAFRLRIQSDKIKALPKGLYFVSQFTFTKPSFTIKPLILNTYFSFAFNVALKVPF